MRLWQHLSFRYIKCCTGKDRLDDTAQIQTKYLVLQSQYEALAALVKDSDTSNAVQVRTD